MKILRPRAAAAKLGLSRMHLYRLERAGGFPKRVQLGPNSVGWLEDELDEWIRERADAREQMTRKRGPLVSKSAIGQRVVSAAALRSLGGARR